MAVAEGFQDIKGRYQVSEVAPEECPECKGVNIRAIDRPKAKTVAGRIWTVLGGVFLFVAAGYLVPRGFIVFPNEQIAGFMQILGLFVGLRLVWIAVLGRSDPIFGFYMAAPVLETHALCGDCLHTWVVSTEAPLETPAPVQS